MQMNNDMLAEEAAAPVSNESEDKDAITLEKFTSAIVEIEQQPAWRGRADREMDYSDGNQLDSEILQAQRDQQIDCAQGALLVGRKLLEVEAKIASLQEMKRFLRSEKARLEHSAAEQALIRARQS